MYRSQRIPRPLLIAMAIVLMVSPALGGTWSAFGPKAYTRAGGAPTKTTSTFDVLNPTVPFTIRVTNGIGETAVTSATVILNGARVWGPSDFKKKTTLLEKEVNLAHTNTLDVELNGKPGSAIEVEIIGVDNDRPTIEAALDPVPNSNGWNRSDVTVTFTCTDETSGISFCSDPVVLTQEGENQVIVGEARDLAGNSATLEVIVSIDKTPPVVSSSIEPLPNSDGWNNSDVMVTFSGQDALSGLNRVTDPITVSTEGASIPVEGVAEDLAGNIAIETVSLMIDRTPPALEPVYDPPLVNGLALPNVEVSFAATDTLSGLATVSAPVVLAARGPNQEVTGTATDVAGNGSSESVTVDVNRLPIADAGSDQAVEAGQPTSLDASNSSDPDGHDLSFSWIQIEGPLVSLQPAAGETPSFTPASGGRYAFVLTVNDGLEDSVPDTAVVDVYELAEGVIITGNAEKPATYVSNTGDTYTFTLNVPTQIGEGSVFVSASDPIFMKKVVGVVSSSADEAVVEVQDATLEEVFDFLSIREKRKLVQPGQKAAPGIPTVELYNEGGVLVALGHDFSVDPDLTFELDIRFGRVKHFKGAVEFDVSTTASLELMASAGFNAEAELILPDLLPPIDLHVHPLVVLTIGTELSLGARFSSEVEGSLEIGATARRVTELGATYNGTNWAPIAEDTGIDLEVVGPEVSLAGRSSIRGYLGGEVSVLINRVVGPNYRLEPYVDMTEDIDFQTGEGVWSVGAGVAAAIGVRVEFLSRVLAEQMWPLPDLVPRVELASGRIPVGRPDLRVYGDIVFFNYKDGNNNLYRMEEDGSGLEQLTSDPGEDLAPAWSPDGKKFAFVSNRHGDYDLFVMKADGTEITQLTFDVHRETYPDWSPDGKKIAFNSDATGGGDIYVINSDGTGLQRLTTDANPDELPIWSTDGQAIAWATWRTHGNADLWTMNPDGSGKAPLIVQSGAYVIPGSYSPDGSKLSYSIDPAASADLYVYDLQAGTSTRLTTDGGASAHPVWSADSKYLVYSKGGGSAVELYIISADGSYSKRLTDNSYHDRQPSWGEAFHHIGSAQLGGQAERVVTLSNSGVAPLHVSGIQSSNSSFTADPSGAFVIPGRGQADVTVRFTPDAEETQYSMLTVSSTDPAGDLRLLVNGYGEGDVGSRVVYEEDFDSYQNGQVLNDWIPHAPGKDTALPRASNATYVSPPQSGAIANDFGMIRIFDGGPVSGIVTIQLNAKPKLGWDTNFGLGPILEDGTNDPTGPHPSIIQKNETDRWFYNMSGSVPFAQVENRWVSIRIDYNTRTARYDLYFDDALQASDILLSPNYPGMPVQGLRLSSGRGGRATTSYVDDIRVTVEPEGNSGEPEFAFFDGFEDRTVPAENGWTIVGQSGQITTEESHSGSQSVKLNYATQLRRTFPEIPVEEANTIVVWFYDTMQTGFNWDAAIQVQYDSGIGNTGIGWYSQSDPYYRVIPYASLWRRTSVARSLGWHKFEFRVRANGSVDGYIDDELVASDMYQASTISGILLINGEPSHTYFDDVSVGYQDHPATKPIIPRRTSDERLLTTGLLGAFPNPSNPQSTIRYQLSEQAEVSLKVYNVLGQVVRHLVSERQYAGDYSVAWDGVDDRGQTLGSGVYLYRFRAGSTVETRSMLLLK